MGEQMAQTYALWLEKGEEKLDCEVTLPMLETMA